MRAAGALGSTGSFDTSYTPGPVCARARHSGVSHGTSWLARYKAVHGITQVIIISQRHPATLLRQRRNGDGRRRGLEEFVLVNWRLGDLAVTEQRMRARSRTVNYNANTHRLPVGILPLRLSLGVLVARCLAPAAATHGLASVPCGNVSVQRHVGILCGGERARVRQRRRRKQQRHQLCLHLCAAQDLCELSGPRRRRAPPA